MLYEKLEYYEVKMIGYNSPSFEPRYSSSSPSHLSNLDYWLEKVWVVENQIKEINKQYLRFSKFMNLLDKEIRLIIHDRYFENIQLKEILTKYKIDRNKYYYKEN